MKSGKDESIETSISVVIVNMFCLKSTSSGLSNLMNGIQGTGVCRYDLDHKFGTLSINCC